MSTSREPTPVTWSPSHSLSKLLPSMPAAPLIKPRIATLFVLSFPVVSDVRVIVRKPALVLRVVIAIREVNQLGRLSAQRFVSVSNARWNQDFPRPEHSDIHRVDKAECCRAAAQIAQKHLQHSDDRRPQVCLHIMIMNRFDGTRIRERRRNLDLALSRRNHPRRYPGRTQAGQLGKESPIVRLYLHLLDFHAGNQVRGIGTRDDFSEASCRATSDGKLQAVTGSNDRDSFVGQAHLAGLCLTVRHSVFFRSEGGRHCCPHPRQSNAEQEKATRRPAACFFFAS